MESPRFDRTCPSPVRLIFGVRASCGATCEREPSTGFGSVWALDGSGGPDLKPEIEARVGRLFRWHIDPAPLGLWIDRIDERGRSLASEVPASIFYHLVYALTQYLDGTAGKG